MRTRNFQVSPHLKRDLFQLFRSKFNKIYRSIYQNGRCFYYARK
nr:MAG TPA: hypothetical protein [Caudoviricetes sp.]